jgi:hypothetical protein
MNGPRVLVAAMKQCFSFFLALGVIAFAGCSSEQPGPDDGNSRLRNESGFCTEWARAVCNGNVVTACEYAGGVDGCRDFQLEYCLNLVPPGYSSAHAQDCIDAAKTAFSDASISAEEASEVLNLGGECSRLVDGGIAEGGVCSSDFDCNMVDENHCVIKAGAFEGTCQVPIPAGGGERCDDEAAVCDDGFYCDGRNCLAVLEANEDCTNDDMCGSAALCVLGADGTGQCTPKLESQAACTLDGECKSNFCVNGRCRLRVQLSLDVPQFCVAT